MVQGTNKDVRSKKDEGFTAHKGKVNMLVEKGRKKYFKKK